MSGDTVLRSVLQTPGINKNTTDYGAEGGWINCDKIRFRSGQAEKLSGWVRASFRSARNTSNLAVLEGVQRAIQSWSALDGGQYIAFGGNRRIELAPPDGLVYDITPYRIERSLNNVISTVNGSPIVTISDTAGAHGLEVGEYVYVDSQAAPVGGITLSGEYTVIEIVSTTVFRITASSNANATVNDAGGALEINYLLEFGEASNTVNTGYGGGTWNTPGAGGQGYGRPRSSSDLSIRLRQVSFDNWGEDLVACISNGKIYHWDKTNGVTTRLQVLSNAPSKNSFILVSQPSRHLIAFGSEVFTTGVFDPLIIRWAERETLNNWAITATNSAGEYRLPKGNRIVAAIQTRYEILVLTDDEAYSMRFVGGNEVFSFQPLGSRAGAVGQNCGSDVNGVAYWWGVDNFYYYDGAVRTMPCSIRKFLFDQDGGGRINFNQREKVFCATNTEFNEVWWFYPSFDSDECNRYVCYNHLEQLWYDGALDRTVWEDRSVFSKPFAVDAQGRIYVHETGKDADGAPLNAFIESAYFDIDEGQQFAFVDRIIPDATVPDNKNMEILIKTKKYPFPQAEVITKGPYIFNPSVVDKIDMRARGRQISITYASNVNGGDFSLGKTRIAFQPDGAR